MPVASPTTQIYRIKNQQDVEIPSDVIVRRRGYIVIFKVEFERFEKGDMLVFHHEQQVWHHFKKPDDLDASCSHTQHNLGWLNRDEGELALMIAIMPFCLDMHGRMLDWPEMDEERRAGLKKAVDKWVKEIGPEPRKEDKVRLRWRLDSSKEAVDGRGHKGNWPASAMKAYAAAGDAERLIASIQKICPKIQNRQHWAQLVIAYEEARTRILWARVKGLLDRVRCTNDGVTLPGSQVQDMYRIMLEMNKTVFDPWVTTYRQCNELDLKPAIEKLLEQKPSLAVPGLEATLISLECQMFQREQVKLYKDVSTNFSRRPRLPASKRRVAHDRQLLRDRLDYARDEVSGRKGGTTNEVVVDKMLNSRPMRKWHRRTGKAIEAWDRRDWNGVKNWLEEGLHAWSSR